MEPIVKGMFSGIGYGMLLGPLFFMNVRTTVAHGIRQGVALVTGALVSDTLLVLGSWWSADKLEEISSENLFQNWFGVICGLMLFGFGLSAALPNKRRDYDREMRDSQPLPKRRNALFQGFLINTTTPSNWVFWLGVATAAAAAAPEEDENYPKLFMVAALIALFCTDLSKVFLANYVAKKMKPGTPEKIVRLAGIILMGVSVWLLIRVVQNVFEP